MHPALALANGALVVGFYTGARDGDADGSVRLVATRPKISATSRVVHFPLRFVSRRRDPAWAGDYFGVAAAPDGAALVAYVDNASGVPHVAFEKAQQKP
jgi:hypothetical protein